MGTGLLGQALSVPVPTPRVKKQRKEPVQLELFVPREEGYEFKVVVTNKRCTAKTILLFHNGRGSQENIFSELKGPVQYGLRAHSSACRK